MQVFNVFCFGCKAFCNWCRLALYSVINLTLLEVIFWNSNLSDWGHMLCLIETQYSFSWCNNDRILSSSPGVCFSEICYEHFLVESIFNDNIQSEIRYMKLNNMVWIDCQYSSKFRGYDIMSTLPKCFQCSCLKLNMPAQYDSHKYIGFKWFSL